MGWRVTGGGRESPGTVGVVESDHMRGGAMFGDRVGGVEKGFSWRRR